MSKSVINILCMSYYTYDIFVFIFCSGLYRNSRWLYKTPPKVQYDNNLALGVYHVHYQWEREVLNRFIKEVWTILLLRNWRKIY